MPRVAFVFEQNLGHVTHYLNLRRTLDEHPDITPSLFPVPVAGVRDRWERLMGEDGNYSLKLSLRARELVLPAVRAKSLEGALVHTQVLTLLLGRLLADVPTVISIDATPASMDRLAAAYGHRVRPWYVERAKAAIMGRIFRSARAIVCMSRWAKESAVADYGVPEHRVHVVPPGVDVETWRPLDGVRREGSPLRILFTGGDLARKGGDALLRWARETTLRGWELHMVTRADVPKIDGVFVHRVSNNSNELVRLAQRCHLFVLPTRGDCSSIASLEALAAGLPVVTTRVGGMAELVEDGVSGFVVEPGDYDALKTRLEQLLSDQDLRAAMSNAARARAVRSFDARRNFGATLSIVRNAVTS